MPELIRLRDWAQRHDMPHPTVAAMVRAGRIEGAVKTEAGWLIPADAAVPPMRASRAPLVTPPEGLIPLAQWAREQGVTYPSALKAHGVAGTLDTTGGGRFVRPGPITHATLTYDEWAAREGLSAEYASKLARAGKLEGAQRIGAVWHIPKTLTWTRKK
ncbi:hypothetical protein IHN63_02665 [Deinococcus sp. 6YEL10]|uniref:hypothetical protein n=1 Tax=Deinococcus sp. 6YEL10 TaxID=2745870 RepID=UPI001E292504|nr:hypothetical protein [Deinococcus sp. 6YEL10]MCD0160203.1 hypothetical protein [Deinococcus sp. 6YEL10]